MFLLDWVEFGDFKVFECMIVLFDGNDESVVVVVWGFWKMVSGVGVKVFYWC